MVTSLMRMSGVGRLVEALTGWSSRVLRVVEEGVGSSIMWPKMVCLVFRWGRAR